MPLIKYAGQPYYRLSRFCFFGIIKSMIFHGKKDVASDEFDAALAATVIAGRKLAVLIAALPVVDEVKQAFFALIENASYDELLALEDALEGLYLDAATQDADKQLKAALEQLKMETDARARHRDDAFLDKLKVIENRIAA